MIFVARKEKREDFSFPPIANRSDATSTGTIPPMQKWLWRIGLLWILLLSATLRIMGNGWDQYEHYHPDERYIAWVATSIELPTSLRTAFDPQSARFNPYYWPDDFASECVVRIQGEQRNFAYGHLPLYAGVFVTHLTEVVAPALFDVLPPTCFAEDGTPIASELDRMTAVGRLLTAFIDIGTIAFTWLLARRLFDDKVALLAAALLGLTVQHIQLAHFFTFDPWMTFFVVAAIYWMVRAAQSGHPKLNLTLAAASSGLAVGSKFAAVMLALPLLLSWWWVSGKRFWDAEKFGRIIPSFLGLFLSTLIPFALTNPFALLDWTCTVQLGAPLANVNIPSCFLANIGEQSGMVSGSDGFPFTRQYFGTRPYLYFIEQHLRWGMGPLLGLAAYVGFGWVVVTAARQFNLRKRSERSVPVLRESNRPIWIVLMWCLPFFLLTGNFFVKFMRYMQPLVPFLMIFAAAFLVWIRPKILRTLLITAVLLTTGLYAWSFVNIYRQPHPWVTASKWIYENVPPDSVILTERWGDRLPSTLIEDGVRLSARSYRYQQDELTWLSGTRGRDNEEKYIANLQRLATADYIVIESNRIYGVVPRLPVLYPISSQVHERLFDGSLGYEATFVTTRLPHIGRNHLKPDFFSWPDLTPPAAVQELYDTLPGPIWGRADESFTLYDQSLVIILENRGGFSAETLNEILTDQ